MSGLAYERNHYLQPEPHEGKEKLLETRLRLMGRELFYAWMFISQEGLWEEAREFIHEHGDEPTPLEW